MYNQKATRKIELFMFLVQMVTLVTYILLCKCFKNLKSISSKGELDETDPFIGILTKDNEDFIAKESFLMKIPMLLIVNNYINVFISFERFNEPYIKEKYGSIE